MYRMKRERLLCRDDLKCPPLCSGHSQRKNYFIIAIEENLRIFLNCFFTEGIVKGNSICSATFCESVALRKRLSVCFWRAKPSQVHIRSPAPPKGELFAVTAQFPDKVQTLRMRQKLPLSGELANPKDLTERVHPTKKELPCETHSSSRKGFYKITGSGGWGRGTGTRRP